LEGIVIAVVAVSSSQRAQIAKLAVQLSQNSGHFLNVAQGAEPGFRAGPLNRLVTAKPQRFKPSSPMLQTAGITSICKGRFKTAGGRVIRSRKDKEALKQYLLEQETIFVLGGSVFDMQPFERTKGTDGRLHALFPRKVGEEIILGERCIGHRHFDCIGFVNFCVSQVLNPKWNRSFLQYKRDFDPIALSDLQPGDIVIRIKGEKGPDGKAAVTNHAGICHVHPTLGIRILNCAAGSTGLVSSPYTRVRWPHRRRINRFFA
jgi:hypothetical protein